MRRLTFAVIEQRARYRLEAIRKRDKENQKDMQGMGSDIPTVVKTARKSIEEAEGLIVEAHLERTERAWELDYGREVEDLNSYDKERLEESRRTIEDLKAYITEVLQKVRGGPQGSTISIAGRRMLPKVATSGTPKSIVSLRVLQSRNDEGSDVTIDDLRKWVDEAIDGIRRKTLSLYHHLVNLRSIMRRLSNENRDVREECKKQGIPKVSREPKTDDEKICELRTLLFGDGK